MRKFIKNVLLFLVVLLVFIFSIECLLLYQTNVYSYKRKYVETHLNDIKVLLLGNSHFEQGLNPQLISDSTFNLAIQGRDKKYDVELAKKYFPHMKNLKVAIMPLDYFDFHFGRVPENTSQIKTRDEKYSSTYKCMYYKYMGIHIDEWWYWSEVVNSRLNYMTRFFLSDEEARECDSLGYLKYDIVQRRTKWMHERLPEYIDTSMDVDKDLYFQLYSYYEAIARTAQCHGVKLVLISTPVYKTYQELINHSVYNEMHLFSKRIMEEFPVVGYYDFTYDERFSEEDFYDASHLCDAGARKLSLLVSEIVKDELSN